MTMETPQIKSLQAAFRAMPVGTPSKENCPEPALLWAAVQGEAGGLSPDKRREVVRHAATCSACAEDWRVTSELWKTKNKIESNGSPCEVLNGHPSWFRKTQPKVAAQVAAAGLVVLAVGVGGWFFHQTPESNFRGAQKELQQTLSFNLDGAALSRDDFVLRWEPTSGTTYKITVMNRFGDFLVTKSDLESPEFRVPPEALKKLPSGSEVLWQVEVADPEKGTRLLGIFSTYVD